MCNKNIRFLNQIKAHLTFVALSILRWSSVSAAMFYVQMLLLGSLLLLVLLDSSLFN